jgi:hypothetical protein
MKKLGLYISTLAYLRPSQVAWFLYRRFLPQLQSIPKSVHAKMRVGVAMVPGVAFFHPIKGYAKTLAV